MGRGKRKTRERRGERTSAEVSPTKPKPEDPHHRQIEIPDPEIAGGTDERNLTQEGQKRIAGDVPHESDGDRRPTEETRAGDGADEGRHGPSVYLVACHWDWSRSRKPYSVYEMKMTDAAVPSDDDAPSRSPANRKRRLRRLGSLETIAGGKVFTAVRSSRRAWIVGVGGDHGDTVIFDTETKLSIQGPRLKSAKWCPVLTAVGDRVYAMSKIPSWKKDPDFPPWFEVLDLSNSRVVAAADAAGSSYLEDCSWSEVPIPARLPWKLHPIEYNMLPFVKLWSCAVVGRYILVSFNHPWGTHALDTCSYEWHKVDDERLPFFGCAVRHGCIFLALPKENGPAINAYSIGIAPSGKDGALKLSVDVLPVKFEDREVDSGPCFCSLDDEHFCSLGVKIDTRSIALNTEYNEWFPRKALVKLKTYETEDTSASKEFEALLAVKRTIIVSSQREQDLKISSSSHGCSPFGFALLSM